jgi:hypothetical protein
LLALRVIMDGVGNKDRPRLGNGFEACRDVHPIPKEIAVLFDHIANVNSYPEFYAALVRDTQSVLSNLGLDREGATHRIDRARKLGEKPVSGVLEHPAVVGLDAGIEQLATNAIEPIKGVLFVCAD